MSASPPRRRGGIWLACAGLCIAVAAWLMWDGRIERPEPPEVEFPRRMTPDDWERAQVRLAPLPPLPREPDAEPDDTDTEEATEPVLHDPFLAALGGDAPAAAVLEVSALRHGPFGDRVVSCLRGPIREGIDEMRAETGIDLVEDLDRVAFVADGDAFGMLVSGHFPDGGWEKVLDVAFDAPRRWGDGWIYGSDGDYVGLWRDEVLILGDSESAVRDRIDYLEGRRHPPSAPLSFDETYGELYGALSTNLIVELLEAFDPDVARRARDLLLGGQFNLSAAGDVGMVSRLEATSHEAADDLARLLAGALSVARTAARREGEDRLADLLDLAKVVRPRHGDTAFSLELALPESYLDDVLSSWCARLEADFPDEPSEGASDDPGTAFPGGGP